MIWTFQERHAWEQRRAGFVSALWRAWWPGSIRRRVDDLSAQRAGVDAALTGPTAGPRFSCLVEEKIRDHDYGDVLLELVSNDRSGTPGWAVKGAQSRLLLYSIMSTCRGWVFPMQTLQRVARANANLWSDMFGIRDAKNASYTSRNVPVPLSVLAAAIDREHGIVICPACRMVCEWSDLRGPSWCSQCRPGRFEIVLGGQHA